MYVGNLSAKCTESSLKQFVQERSQAAKLEVPVYNCSMHVSETGRTSARLSVNASHLSPVTSANFWPRPLYCRPWRFVKDRSGEVLKEGDKKNHSDSANSANNNPRSDASPTGQVGALGGMDKANEPEIIAVSGRTRSHSSASRAPHNPNA